jgi:hypothetical protein
MRLSKARFPDEWATRTPAVRDNIFMPREDNTAYGSAVRSKEYFRKRVAKVLERVIDPDILPASVKLGNRQVDTAEYIAELADIARLNGSPKPADDAERKPQPG